MAIGVTFPENEDVVTFWWKIERLVRVESKVDIYKKELGNYAGYWLRKVYWKDLHYRGMQISRNALTHVKHNRRSNAHQNKSPKANRQGGAQWAKSGGEAVLLQFSDSTKDPMHDFNRLFCWNSCDCEFWPYIMYLLVYTHEKAHASDDKSLKMNHATLIMKQNAAARWHCNAELLIIIWISE